MIDEDASDLEPAPTPMPPVIALLILSGQIPPDAYFARGHLLDAEHPEHDAPSKPCGCGWCHLVPGGVKP